MLLRTLSPSESGWATQVAGAMFPKTDALPIGADELEVSAFLQEMFRRIPLEAALGLRLTLWMIVLAPIFLGVRFALFVDLAPADQDAVLERLYLSRWYPVRQLCIAWKATIALVYSGHPSVRPLMLGDVRPVLTTLTKKPSTQATKEASHAA
jgi:hypothetical protein